MKCDEIFSNFLVNISKYLTPVGFSEITYFFSLLRLILNEIGWEKILLKDGAKKEIITK